MRLSAQGHYWDQPAITIRHDGLKPGRKQDKVLKKIERRKTKKSKMLCGSQHTQGGSSLRPL